LIFATSNYDEMYVILGAALIRHCTSYFFERPLKSVQAAALFLIAPITAVKIAPPAPPRDCLRDNPAHTQIAHIDVTERPMSATIIPYYRSFHGRPRAGAALGLDAQRDAVAKFGRY